MSLGFANLSWNANSEPDLAGYTVHHGWASGNYFRTVVLGLVTSHSFNDLPEGIQHFFAVTARDTSNNVSGFSNEVSKTPARQSLEVVF